MASIGGLSSSSSNFSSIKGFGGLASGLDRDSLIEQMTSRTQSKIQKQKQEKQRVTWQQEAIRNITDKMVEFSQKYLSFTSDTNFLSSTFYSRNVIESLGANAGAVSVTGSSPFLSDMAITSIDSLATNAQLTSTDAIASQFKGNTVSNTLNEKEITSALSGKSFEIKLGGKEVYSIELPEGNDNYGVNLSDPDQLAKTVETLNKALEKVSLKDGKDNLRSKMEFSVVGDKISITNKDGAGNSITLMSGDDVFRSLGIIGADDKLTPNDDAKKITIGSGASLTGSHNVDLTKEVNQKELLKNSTLTFSYNGQRKDIKIDPNATINTVEDYAAELQKSIDKAYGADKITVSFSLDQASGKGQLSLTTKDDHATLTLESATKGVLGQDSIIGLSKGDGNRLNLNKKVSEIDGLKDLIGKKLTINNKEVEVKEDMTLQNLFDTIEKDAGVSIKYSGFLDKVTMTSSEQGSKSEISIKGEEAQKLFQFLKMGKVEDSNGQKVDIGSADPSQKYTLAKGTDAEFTLKYPGAGDVKLTRSSNTFEVDGLTFTLKNTFGPNATSGNKSTEAVTFSSKVSTEDMTKSIKEMIEAYNGIITEVNSQLTAKNPKNEKYPPLTDQQKKEMTENQITEWEKKAKVGLLFGDSDLRTLSNDLRFVLPSGATRQALAEIGITTSTNYSDNGKLTFDEKKFKQAMEANPDKIRSLFTGTSGDEKTSFVQNIKDVMDKYARTTGDKKGVLIQRAGSKHSPLSMINNTMQSKLDGIQKAISNFETSLKAEQNRYVKQFTQLERIISKMNTQSSWLSQQFG